MQFDVWTLALQVVNFAILAWLLYRFLYRPVLRMVDLRRAEIDRQQQEAGALTTKAKDELAAIARERVGIVAERAAALKAAAAEAEAASAARRAKSEQDCAAMIETARKTLAGEREAAALEIRRQSIDLGIDIARRLLAEIPPPLRAEAWLEQIERHLATLSDVARQELLGGLADGEIKVVTAAALPADAAEAWRRRLGRAVGDGGAAIAFAADPALLAGAELYFPTAILRFSWRDEIAALRSEIENHGNAG